MSFIRVIVLIDRSKIMFPAHGNIILLVSKCLTTKSLLLMWKKGESFCQVEKRWGLECTVSTVELVSRWSQYGKR